MQQQVIRKIPEELENYELIFHEDASINFISSQQKATRILNCRVFTLKTEDGVVQHVKIELTDDKDISFIYESNFSRKLYDESIKETYKLLVDFDAFIENLCIFLQKSLKASDEITIDVIDGKEKSKIVFYQKLKLRTVEVFTLPLNIPDEDYIMRLAQCRFNILNEQLAARTKYLDSAFKTLDNKNPSLASHVRSVIQQKEDGTYKTNSKLSVL
ncbi:hypothetical protein TVAG_392430 [Trichomonas vaginalis G3]|uniref:Spindle assembly abnormal protein 6 N-terminal domain-containing protein n=1 Tax=Trichomonas vaginalis (strain ATCC PRA-98 / G3) TaxID=412133 RepID=A2DWU4_TRIV3|nr:assembly abnormal protein 6-related family [Trichomonas vaginalis G3]EAY15126.1 hypothetical protein TVAG_392430 [Trichomonas vaginalis G3]KAI5499182.1 assembly abnormal protein 6-related family [Trichomonas vaginalis G3]|eukprot:XP_001327349.1 hypothetical protein [Trichomonas vaginalis G3]